MSRTILKPLTTQPGLESLRMELPEWLPRQRWFGAKTRAIASVEIVDWVALATAVMVVVEVLYAEGGVDTYQLPLAIATVDGIQDSTGNEQFRQALLKLIEGEVTLELHNGGTLCAHGYAELRGQQPLTAKVSKAEQSNTSIIFGDKMILKLFRRLQPGENPDVEIGRFLTEVAHFPHIPALLGEITLRQSGEEKTYLAMLQGLVANEGDGWQWTLDELARFYASPGQQHSTYLEAASLLGQRTAQMHLALATETSDAAFRSEPLTATELTEDAQRIRTEITLALDALEQALPSLEGNVADDAATILRNRAELLAQADVILSEHPSGRIIRIHGDYHLGQILRTTDDFVILDFEGEPARSLAERRAKRCPLKDVAGMLRSFSYAAWTGLDHRQALLPQLQLWQDAVSSRFLNAYRESIAAQPDLLPQPALADSLLRAYLLEKACYELLYELNNRPAWVGIPIAGLLALLAPNPATR